jgi:hypothetical protein
MMSNSGRATERTHRAAVFGAACCAIVACEHGSSARQRVSDGSASVACVDVSHVGALQRRDLHVIGSGFDAYDGLMIRILATLGEPEYGLGEAPITGGSFDMLLPGVLGDYTGIAVHVDRVRDNACNPSEEFIWQLTTGTLSALGPDFSTPDSGAIVWSIAPDMLKTFPQAGPCNLNGIFDLTQPVTCPAPN